MVMKRIASLWSVLLVLAAGLAACGTTTIITQASPDGSTNNTGGVALSADKVTTPGSIQTVPPAAGRGFVVLDITLQNVSSPKAVSAGFSLFSLTTDQALVLTTAAASSVIANGCLPGTSVALGGQFSCTLAFEVPVGQVGQKLNYDDLAGHAAAAAIPAPPAATTCDKLNCIQRTAVTNTSCTK